MKLSSFEYNNFFNNVANKVDEYNERVKSGKQNVDQQNMAMLDVQKQYVALFTNDIPSISHTFAQETIQYINDQNRMITDDTFLDQEYYIKNDYEYGSIIDIQNDIEGQEVSQFVNGHIEQFKFPNIEQDKVFIYSDGVIKQENGLVSFSVTQDGQQNGDKFILNRFEYIEDTETSGYIQPEFVAINNGSISSFNNDSNKIVEFDYSNVVQNNHVRIIFNKKTSSPLFRDKVYQPEVRSVDEFGIVSDTGQKSFRFQLPEQKPSGYFQVSFIDTQDNQQNTMFVQYDEISDIVVQDNSGQINYFTIGQQSLKNKMPQIDSIVYMSYISKFAERQTQAQENYSLKDIYDLLIRKAIQSISPDSYNLVQDINIQGQTNINKSIERQQIQQILPDIVNNNYAALIQQVDSNNNQYIGYKTKDGQSQWYNAVLDIDGKIIRDDTITSISQKNVQLIEQYDNKFDVIATGYYGEEDDLEDYFNSDVTIDAVLQERLEQIFSNNIKHIRDGRTDLPGDPKHYIRKKVSVSYSIIPSFFEIEYIREVDISNLAEQIRQILLYTKGIDMDIKSIERDALVVQVKKSQSNHGKQSGVGSNIYNTQIQEVLVKVMGQQVYKEEKVLSELLRSYRYIPQNAEEHNNLNNISEIEQPQWLITDGRDLSDQYQNTIKDFVFIKFNVDMQQEVTYQTYNLYGSYDQHMQIKKQKVIIGPDDNIGSIARIGNRETRGSFDIKASCYKFNSNFNVNFIPYYKKYSFDISMKQHDFVQFKGKGIIDTDKMKYMKLPEKITVESQRKIERVIGSINVQRTESGQKELDNVLELMEESLMSNTTTGLSQYYSEGDVSDVYPLNARDNYDITTYKPIDKQYNYILNNIGENIRGSVVDQLSKEKQLTSWGVDKRPRIDYNTFTSVNYVGQNKDNDSIQRDIDNAQSRTVQNTEQGNEYGRKRSAVDQLKELNSQQSGKVRSHLSKTYGKVGIGYDTYVYTKQESGFLAQLFTVLLSIVAVVASVLTFGVGFMAIQVAVAQIGGIYGIQNLIVSSYQGTPIDVNISDVKGIGTQLSINNIDENFIKNLNSQEIGKTVIAPLLNSESINMQQVQYDMQNSLRMIAKSPDDSKEIKGIEEIRFIMNNPTDIIQTVIPYGLVSTSIDGQQSQTIQRKNTQTDMDTNNRIIIGKPSKINSNTYSFRLSDIKQVDLQYREFIVSNIENINTFSLAGFLVYYANNQYRDPWETTYYKYLRTWENTETKWFLKKIIHRKQWTNELKEYSIETPVFGIKDIRFIGSLYSKTSMAVPVVLKNILPEPTTFSDITINVLDDQGEPLDASILTGVVGQKTDIGMKVIINNQEYDMVQSTVGDQTFQLSNNSIIDYNSEGQAVGYNNKEQKVIDEIRPIIYFHNKSFYGSAKIGRIEVNLY